MLGLIHTSDSRIRKIVIMIPRTTADSAARCHYYETQILGRTISKVTGNATTSDYSVDHQINDIT